MKKNDFNAVEMVRQIRDEHHKLLERKTNNEIKTFYKEKSKSLEIKLNKLSTKSEAIDEIETVS